MDLQPDTPTPPTHALLIKLRDDAILESYREMWVKSVVPWLDPYNGKWALSPNGTFRTEINWPPRNNHDEALATLRRLSGGSGYDEVTYEWADKNNNLVVATIIPRAIIIHR
jgi:hypothetical protein